MQLCPVLVSVLFRHQQVSYANIKLWWKFQNVTQFLWRAALHFLIFELSINKSRRAGSPIEVSLIFQQNNRTYTISQCIRYQLCCFLSSKIFKFLHPHCTAECDCMETVAEWSWRTYPAPLGAGGVGSIPANPDALNVPSFRRRRFEMKLSPL